MAWMRTESQRDVLLEVASLSLRLARKYVEPYSHRNSPQKFTQAQLLSCLILRADLKTTYRGLIEIPGVSDRLRDALGLRSLPHDSTLKRFADRSSVLEVIDAMLLELVRQCDGDSPEEAAIDATGYDAEWVHEFCRDDWQVESIIKPAVHRSGGQHNGTYRSEMTEETRRKRAIVDGGWSNHS